MTDKIQKAYDTFILSDKNRYNTEPRKTFECGYRAGHLESYPLMLDTLKKVMDDYSGLISLCQTYGLHATKKDAIETVEYIEGVIKAAEGDSL